MPFIFTQKIYYFNLTLLGTYYFEYTDISILSNSSMIVAFHVHIKVLTLL